MEYVNQNNSLIPHVVVEVRTSLALLLVAAVHRYPFCTHGREKLQFVILTDLFLPAGVVLVEIIFKYWAVHNHWKYL